MLTNFLKNLNLQQSERVRIDCPICYNKNTFSAFNDGSKVVYNCFHADCSIKGRSRNPLTKQLFQQLEKQKEPEIFYYRNHWEKMTTNRDYIHYIRQYDLSEHTEIMRYDRILNRVVFLTYKDKNLIGAVGRALDKTKNPKWYRYDNSGYPFVAGKSDTAVVVEDIVSALRISKFATGIALLGTNLLQSHIDVIKQYNKVGIALDKDASKKAIKILDELNMILNVKFLLLEDDVKEMEDDDIKKLVNKVDKKAWGWLNDTY